MDNNFQSKVQLIWQAADVLRGDYKATENADVILPLTVLRRLDCVLEPTREAVLAKYEALKDKLDNLEPTLTRTAGQSFYNTSRFSFPLLLADPNHVAANLRAYVNGFSPNARDILERFEFDREIDRLAENNLLLLLVQRFASVDLHPNTVPNHEMGYVFEELIRRFSEQSNETAGEHFTPREVIRLMVNVLVGPDEQALKRDSVVRTVYDPTAGTGGMLTVAKEHILADVNPRAHVELFGQELNPKSYAICKSDMLVKGEPADNIRLGNSLSNDHFAGARFNYLLTNPPFGVEWKKVEAAVRREAERGFSGRFGAGLPRINDGSLLFLQHLVSKMHRDGETSRIAIVLNGSPLFTGDAGSGESEIRRWLLEEDLLEAIIALPTELFYNTGIATYVWVLDANKRPERRGKVQLVNAVGFATKMRRSLGSKRNLISPEHILEITRLYEGFSEGEHVRIYDSREFGYRKVTVDRPLRLNFDASEERIALLDGQKALRKVLADDGDALRAALRRLAGTVYKNAKRFGSALDKATGDARIKLKTPERNAIVDSLSERDETAEVVLGKDGRTLPDPELRDYENVPLGEDVSEYFAREVTPFLPDAWVDESVCDLKDGQVGRVGYEINFTRFFYTNVTPRPLEMIDADIRALESEVIALLREVVG